MSICGTSACVVPTKPDTMAAATPAAAAAFRIAGLDAGFNVAFADLPSAQDAATRSMRCSVDCPDDPVPRHQHDLVLGRGQCQSTKGEKVARDGRCNEGAADAAGSSFHYRISLAPTATVAGPELSRTAATPRTVTGDDLDLGSGLRRGT